MSRIMMFIGSLIMFTILSELNATVTQQILSLVALCLLAFGGRFHGQGK